MRRKSRFIPKGVFLFSVILADTNRDLADKAVEHEQSCQCGVGIQVCIWAACKLQKLNYRRAMLLHHQLFSAAASHTLSICADG